MTGEPTTLTELLSAAQRGDTDAQSEAAQMVYAHLHELADSFLRRERGDHTLQPTALVNEAYLRLLGQDAPWQNRAHYFGIAAQMMHRILVDYARRESAAKRDRARIVTADDGAIEAQSSHDASVDILGVHEALETLERLDPQQAKIIELRFFVGLSIPEIAATLGISPSTVSREWAMARVWLHERLRDQS